MGFRKMVPLGEVCEIRGGYPFKSEDFSSRGIPVIKIANVRLNHIIADRFSHIPETLAQEKSKWLIRKDEILLTMTGNSIECAPESWVGKAARFNLSGRYLLNQRVAAVRSSSAKLEPVYLGYYLSSGESQLYFVRHANSSGGQANISADMVKDYPIAILPVIEQKKIAALLGGIDRKIELNRSIIHNLEQQAEAVFEHHVAGNSAPAAASAPASGWEKGSLLDIADYLNGRPLQQYRLQEHEEGIPVLKITELRHGFCDRGSERCSSRIRPELVVQDGDVVFSWAGRLLLDIWCGGRCVLSKNLFKVTSGRYDRWFYYLWTRHYLNRFMAIATDRATTTGHIRREDLAQAEVLIPPAKEYQNLSVLLNPVFDRIMATRIESLRLQTIRDTLQPKLLAGTLDLSQIALPTTMLPASQQLPA